jgi:hypothetical protein
MKKLLLILTLFLTTLMYSQDNPFLMRAETFQAGTMSYNKEVVWDNTSIKSCDILIKLEEKKVTIYSKTSQVYNVISMASKTAEGGEWYCIDEKGVRCNIYLISLKNNPGKLALGVEYSDYVWYYICKPTN